MLHGRIYAIYRVAAQLKVNTYIFIFFFGSKIAFNYVECLLVNINILVGLQELDLVQPKHLLNDDGVGVGAARRLCLLLSEA